LYQVHGLCAQGIQERDVFVIDCEGLNSLTSEIDWLVHAIFSLAQMAGVVIVVTKELNEENAQTTFRLLQMSSLMPKQNR
jgi:hypothetical protein